jgi:hypothetical protein
MQAISNAATRFVIRLSWESDSSKGRGARGPVTNRRRSTCNFINRTFVGKLRATALAVMAAIISNACRRNASWIVLASTG